MTRDEFWSRLRTVKDPEPGFNRLDATPETLFDSLGRMFTGDGTGAGAGYGRRLELALTVAACLFMLLPAVNLINLNTSRIMERASEIGVRKAFGASSRTLVGQFVVENLVLTLVGAAIGFVLAAWLLQVINASGLIQYAELSMNYRIFAMGRPAGGGLRPALRGLPGLADVAPCPGAGAEGSCAMIRHVFKLIWNRKRTNFLMMTEIFVAFLVLFAVVALGVYTADNWRRPIGFSYERVWSVSIDMKQVSDDSFDAGAAGDGTPADVRLEGVPGDRGVGRHHDGAVPVRLVEQRLRLARPPDRDGHRRGHRRVQGRARSEDRRRAAGSAAKTTARPTIPS